MTHTIAIYRRLLRYTRPYLLRLTLGLCAGMLVGGALLGVLRSSTSVFSLVFGTVPPRIEAGARAVPGVTAPAPVAAPDKVRHNLDRAEQLLARVGIRVRLEATKPDGSMTWQFLLAATIAFPFFFSLRLGLMYLSHYNVRWVGAKVVVDIRQQLFDRLQNQSLRYFSHCDVGQLISRCTYDAASIESAISGTVVDMVEAPVQIGVAMFFIVAFALEHDMLAQVVILFLVFPLCVVPILTLGRIVKRNTRRALDRIAGLVSRMQENFTGIRVVKAYHMETAESARFAAMNRDFFRALTRALRAELAMGPIMEIFAITFACGFVIYCFACGITLASIAPLGLAAWSAFQPVKRLAKIGVSVQRTGVAAERLFQILDADTRIPEAAQPLRPQSFTDRLEFRDVTFRYEPTAPQVLDRISFVVPRGHLVAFVGETGAGKSTVANLLARFYDPDEGQILMDGTDLRQIEIVSLRRLVGVVTQEVIIFNESIAANIAYGSPEATREQIMEAARKANAHEFIMAEPDGYERLCGEKGFRLSGGQRQRLSIARAILRNPPILILDEAYSQLDTVTEQQVQEAVSRLMQERTVFAIAHRLSTIRNANQIFVLDKGRIVERGTHAELFAGSGLYRRLCESQFGTEA